MTDTAFYDRMDSLATKLLTKFGSLATLRTVTMSKPNAQGISTRTTVDKAGLAVVTSTETALKMFEKMPTAVVVGKFPVEPTSESLVLHGGKTWKVMDVKLASPVGVMIVAFLAVTKP
jgi:hypothetical protein